MCTQQNSNYGRVVGLFVLWDIPWDWPMNNLEYVTNKSTGVLQCIIVCINACKHNSYTHCIKSKHVAAFELALNFHCFHIQESNYFQQASLELYT